MSMQRQFKAVQRLLRSPLTRFPKNKTNMELMSVTNCGITIGREVVFSHTDKQTLRRYIIEQCQADPQRDTLDGDRIDVAKITPHEKIRGKAVFGSLILVHGLQDHPIYMTSGSGHTPPGSVLAVDMETIEWDSWKESTIVIVENGTLMHKLNLMKLPAEWGRALCVYRGHGENARSVNDLIDRHPSDKLAFFMDFDLPGIAMATGYRRGSVIVPKNWQDLYESSALNTMGKYYSQQESRAKIYREEDGSEIDSIVEHIDRQHLCVSQESLIAHDVELKAIRNRL
ncbi:hypothetical protein [Saccharospirillum sp.]|uniref:DUF7281 domain-containing protein n=1 Tax=Saccharospirillum sp. TaxID=2033801 RepID=UPI0034A0A7DF